MGVYDQLAELDEKNRASSGAPGRGKRGSKRDRSGPHGKSKNDTTHPSNHDTTVSRHHEAMVQDIKKALRQFGKEAATHRFTPEEKQAIADIIYSYSRQGIRTSENEISRIAVNFIVNDFKAFGEESLLHRILKALRE